MSNPNNRTAGSAGCMEIASTGGAGLTPSGERNPKNHLGFEPPLGWFSSFTCCIRCRKCCCQLRNLPHFPSCQLLFDFGMSCYWLPVDGIGWGRSKRTGFPNCPNPDAHRKCFKNPLKSTGREGEIGGNIVMLYGLVARRSLE
ncbi:hypothetical protein ACROYT_G009724 [Oculina patagonica]